MLEYGTLWYTIRAYVQRAHHGVQHGVDVGESGKISEDDSCLLKWTRAKIGMIKSKGTLMKL